MERCLLQYLLPLAGVVGLCWLSFDARTWCALLIPAIERIESFVIIQQQRQWST